MTDDRVVVARHDRWWPFGRVEVPVLLLGSCAVLYACVPETDQLYGIARMVAGVALIEALWRPHAVVTTMTVVTVAWSGLWAASGRDSATVGAWFALWPLALPLIASWCRPLAGRGGIAARLGVGAIATVAALVVARTGALEPTAGPAVLAVLVAAVVSGMLAAVVWARVVASSATAAAQ